MNNEQMKKYLPATTKGAARIRVQSATLNNTCGQDPFIIWNREEQILGDDGVYRFVPMPPIYTAVNAELLASEIDLLDVDTVTVLGKMSGAAVVVALQSLFIAEDIKFSNTNIDTTIPVPPLLLPEDTETYVPPEDESV